MYVGAKTGRDGIHGATFASEELTESSDEKRPAVQVGDPFMEKLLLEACLEVVKSMHLLEFKIWVLLVLQVHQLKWQVKQDQESK